MRGLSENFKSKMSKQIDTNESAADTMVTGNSTKTTYLKETKWSHKMRAGIFAKKINCKILHELQEPDEKFTNVPCNELFHIFHQIITTNINYFVLTKNREKQTQKKLDL